VSCAEYTSASIDMPRMSTFVVAIIFTHDVRLHVAASRYVVAINFTHVVRLHVSARRFVVAINFTRLSRRAVTAISSRVCRFLIEVT
jgi:predicted HD phosphohydrolase